MKILLTAFTFPPQTSGISVVAQAQACGLASRGHEVTVATEYDSNRKNEDSFGLVKVKEFRISGGIDSRFEYSGEVGKYQEFIAREEVDLILCNCWQTWPTDLAIPVFARNRARKVIVSHGFSAHVWNRQSTFPWGLGTWWRSQHYVLKLPRMMRAFDHLIFLSPRRDFGRFFDHWVATRLGLSNVSVIPNGIHFQELRTKQFDFRERYEIRTKYLLLNVANYCDRKNQIATLRAFQTAGRKDATLVFIGSELNEYAAEVRRVYTQNLNASGPVLFLEKTPKPVIQAAYQEADAFILTAKAETQPLVLLDAMAVGLPFISTNTGCVSEFPGGLVANGNRRTAANIHRLLDDPKLARKLSEEGLSAAASQYSWDQVVVELETLFQRLLQPK